MYVCVCECVCVCVSVCVCVYVYILIISPVRGLVWPKGFQEVKDPTFHDNGTERW